jgi:hypothetical protein
MGGMGMACVGCGGTGMVYSLRCDAARVAQPQITPEPSRILMVF